MRLRLAALGLAALALAGCQSAADVRSATPAIVGAWVVAIPEAPFPLHMFVFHADGTVEQSNPDAGDAATSDSNLMGAWRAAGGAIRGRMVEITADRTTRQLATRGEITFDLRVSGNAFAGTASATFFDASGRQLRGPLQVRMQGTRVEP